MGGAPSTGKSINLRGFYSPVTPIMRSRFKYKVFQGTKKEDHDARLENFEGIARANNKWEVWMSTLSGVPPGQSTVLVQ